ncbi:YciI family protein [Alteriqipengyuania sp. WL0013]|uniref:YciI family protein n=1 Tax=Alteriqipengyuania sp. WL0013 TaxID=3110773 RepID=UPI002C8B839C|nr:YciI family protein [Alteriqipengyuania sp. WL0013]MEB3414768.1 YciI family protein [Alteriqipengyuania sp. WL0013]
MQYMMLIVEDESAFAGEDGAALMERTLAGHMALMEELEAKGVEWSGNRLQGADTATTLKYDGGGEPVLHDGPFAEMREELGGYYIVEAANLDEAVDWARKIPILGNGSVEVRPVWQD